MNNKTELRNFAKNKRKTLDIKSISDAIVKIIKNSDLYKSSKDIMLFYPKTYEIDLRNLLTDETKNFYLPRVSGENIEVCPYKLGDSLELSDFNVYEPTASCVDKNIPQIVFTPALAVDKNGYRLGYGGGYYDKFLKETNAKKIAVIEEELIIDSVPHENHDIKMDGIITQKKSLWLGG